MKITKLLQRTACLCLAISCLSSFGFNYSDEQKEKNDTLVVSCDSFNGIFNPLYASGISDMNVCDFTNECLFNIDRQGSVISHGISGETREYNGKNYTYYGIADCDIENKDDTVKYHINIKKSVRFADGEELNADDLIFTMYVMADPSYTGVQPFASLPIIGIKEYRTGVASSMYAERKLIIDAIVRDGREHNVDGTEIYSHDDYLNYWGYVDDVWNESLILIVDFCKTNYPHLLEKFAGSDIALAMYGWGFAKQDDNSILTGVKTGKQWDLKNGDIPTADDLFNESMALYEGDPDTFYQKSLTELRDNSLFKEVEERFISASSKEDSVNSVLNISGIIKNNDYSVTVVMSELEAVSMYALSFDVLPMHYYGSDELYDYENNCFGFIKGDLSSIKNKNQKPLGAGAYIFHEYKDGIVALKRNKHYYKGVPKIENILLREVNYDDNVDALLTGMADVASLDYDALDIVRIADANKNGKLSGDVVFTVTTDVRSYGYIGINAQHVKVGNDSASDESKALRSAFATLFAVYREIAVTSYFDSSFGCRARVIEYPVPPSSWASPKATDDGYKEAFSVDKNGNPIYNNKMSEQQRYEKAFDATIDFLIEAGYKYDDTAGIFTSAPYGASMEYTIIIPGGGTKAHPSYFIATYAKDALSKVGITLNVIDVADSSNMWDDLSESKCQMWAAAWGKGSDPDLYRIYHSNNIPGEKGSDCNYYSISDDELDRLIIEGRKNTDLSYRKKVYKQCFDIIMDWAVEIPVFTADDMTVFSAERVDVDTLTPDITAFWSWRNDIEKLEIK